MTVWNLIAAVALGAPLVHHVPLPRITSDRLEGLLSKHQAVVVDVRTAYEYRHGHIAGALNWPAMVSLTGYRKLDLPRSKWIVTYCTCAGEYMAAQAGQILTQAGYPHVACLKGGYLPWQHTLRPVHVGDRP